jgi:hypothetical protein
VAEPNPAALFDYHQPIHVNRQRTDALLAALMIKAFNEMLKPMGLLSWLKPERSADPMGGC